MSYFKPADDYDFDITTIPFDNEKGHHSKQIRNTAYIHMLTAACHKTLARLSSLHEPLVRSSCLER
ncbi:hypothetical protein ACLOJK_005755 [Asimina triloba]